MPAIRYGNGSSWTAPVANGRLWTKWGGGWFVPTYVYAKAGDVGAGYWVDTGYRGYPNPPQGIWVHAWDFSNVALGWNGPAAGGAPVVSYDLLQTDSNGNGISQVTVGGSPWGNFGVGQDGYYKFYVRSRAASGLVSGWVGPVQVRIGHTETGYYATENRERYWQSDVIGGAWGGDDPAWIGVPSSVLLNAIKWRNMFIPASSIVTPWGNRTVNWALDSTDYGPINNNLGTVYSHNSTDWGLYNWGNNAAWGVVARGAGWSRIGDGNIMLWIENLWLEGTETYQVSVYYVTRNYQDNGYW